MRTFEEATVSWQKFLSYKNVSDLKLAVRIGEDGSPPLVDSRSICWKAFLLFEDLDHTEWIRRIADSRSAYASVRSHLLRALEHPDEVATGYDPLSEGTESPWAALRQDEALRAEIMQDVDRCMPENLYFRQPETQKMLLDILFVFCKLNPDVSYRQGMHELLAPILWVVEMDALSGKPDGELEVDEQLLCHVCDKDFVEHDTFTLFGIVMQGAKSFYEQAAHTAPSQLMAASSIKQEPKLQNPILARIHRIYDEYLPHVDPQLAQHLRDIDLIPQVFLMKWIRLLFGREFAFDDILAMWDVIFAEDPSLEIVDFICLVMILRLHWDLIDSDYNLALTSLLRYPASSVSPQALALDAIYLRNNLHQSGASHVIQKHTGRAISMLDADKESSLNPPAQNTLGARLQAMALSPSSPGRPPVNIDRIFQDAAKGMYKRGEQWGINKAVRDAIVEVRKGVRDIQNSPTPQRPRTHLRTASRQSASGGGGDADAASKLSDLEHRAAALAKMLKGATDDLWKYHEDAVAGKASEKQSLEALSIAIARVQFTQVYLEDSTVPLPVDEDQAEEAVEEKGKTRSEAGQSSEPKIEDEVAENNDQAILSESPNVESTIPQPPSKSRPKRSSQSQSTEKPDQPADQPKGFQTPRPSLTQSSFSWMLGQDQGSGSFVQANPLPPSEHRRQNRGFLFGDAEPSSAISGSPNDSAKAKAANKSRKKRPEGASKAAEVLFEQETEEWDLGKLEEEKLSEKKEQERKRSGGGRT